MNLNDAKLGVEYKVVEVNTYGDEEMKAFLFSLGCYSGETITVVDKKKNLVVSIKDARYNIDPELGSAIQIEE
ncbi:MAG: ferrous iron transport protein A [Eubacterium sp.]|nr:ferrous iron transport protein A [Eubacterium sp.]